MMTQIGRNASRVCQIRVILMQFHSVVGVKLRLKPLRLVITIILLAIFSCIIYFVVCTCDVWKCVRSKNRKRIVSQPSTKNVHKAPACCDRKMKLASEISENRNAWNYSNLTQCLPGHFSTSSSSSGLVLNVNAGEAWPLITRSCYDWSLKPRLFFRLSLSNAEALFARFQDFFRPSNCPE